MKREDYLVTASMGYLGKEANLINKKDFGCNKFEPKNAENS